MLFKFLSVVFIALPPASAFANDFSYKDSGDYSHLIEKKAAKPLSDSPFFPTDEPDTLHWGKSVNTPLTSSERMKEKNKKCRFFYSSVCIKEQSPLFRGDAHMKRREEPPSKRPFFNFDQE